MLLQAVNMKLKSQEYRSRVRQQLRQRLLPPTYFTPAATQRGEEEELNLASARRVAEEYGCKDLYMQEANKRLIY